MRSRSRLARHAWVWGILWTTCAGAFCGAWPLSGQDAHYWTAQFGPRAALLGGAVIGAVSDVSATFYNPGGLALADSLGFAFSISVLERESTTIEGGILAGDNLSNQGVGLAPTMLGGALKGPEDGDHVFAYSLITRQRTRSSISELLIGAPTGFEAFGSQTTLDREVTERWAGLSWAYPLSPHLGVGATGFGSSRSGTQDLRFVVAGNQAGEGLVSTRRRDFDYQHYSFIGKLGALLKYPSFGLGITLTTPSVRIAGDGHILYADVDVRDETGGPPPNLAAAEQYGLRAEYRRPLSVGAGSRVAIGPIQFHMSAEWFDEVDRYEVISTDPFNGQSPDQPKSYTVEDVRKSVLNWAVATEHQVSEDVTAYVSYSTDISSSLGGAAAGSLVSATWDTQLISFGTDLRVRGHSLTLGGAYGWARSLGLELVRIQKEIGAGILPPLDPTPFRYEVIRLILGLEF